MRLINADALIEILTTAIRNMKGVAKFIGAEDDPELKMEIKAYTDILNGVKEQPTIEPEPHWIPCSERLPEEKINPNTQNYDWVLCSTTFGDVRAYNFGRGRFWHGCGDVTQYVIAWTLLPDPYQRGEKND